VFKRLVQNFEVGARNRKKYTIEGNDVEVEARVPDPPIDVSYKFVASVDKKPSPRGKLLNWKESS
jgi:hypothetical protein